MDNDFYTSEACNGCGICAKICPVNDIRIRDKKPYWQHHCELCLAYFHCCPRKAINSYAFPNTVRYHHPEASLADIIREKESLMC
jgi:MinD superfamily P-loop ATPase